MSTTGPGSAHRHKTKSGYWSDLTDVASGSTHTHQLDTSGFATKAELAALEARVAALEAAPPAPEPPPAGSSVMVADIGSLLAAVVDDSIGEIVVRNGTYPISYLDINGSENPGYIRTAASAVLVRAETTGGVTFDAQGSQGVHQLFRNGSAYQEWRGFRYANSHPYDNGVIQFGEGYGIPVHHITLRDIAFDASISLAPGPTGAYRNGQGIYFSWSKRELGGNHDLLVDGFTCSARLWSAVHVYHDTEGHVGHHVTVRRMHAGPGVTMGLALAATSIHDYVFEDVSIESASEYGVYHYYGSDATTITLRRVTTRNSGASGFYSRFGTYPNVPGVTFVDCDLR